MRKCNNSSSLRGFTLIELVVVVIIIGILAAIALPRYGKTVENSRVAEATSMLGTIRGAQMRYVAEYDVYASILANLDLNITAGRFFDFDVNDASSASPFSNDDEVIATATRNGWSVGGGYHSNYWVKIDERGNFTSGQPGGGGGAQINFPAVF